MGGLRQEAGKGDLYSVSQYPSFVGIRRHRNRRRWLGHETSQCGL